MVSINYRCYNYTQSLKHAHMLMSRRRLQACNTNEKLQQLTFIIFAIATHTPTNERHKGVAYYLHHVTT